MTDGYGRGPLPWLGRGSAAYGTCDTCGTLLVVRRDCGHYACDNCYAREHAGKECEK